VVDREVEDALARSFLAEVVGRLRAEGERADYPAGTTVYRAGSGPQAAPVVHGLLQVYLASVEGRQVTIRYARPGACWGSRCWWAARLASGCRRWSRPGSSGSVPGR
jgi:hypothetical protein